MKLPLRLSIGVLAAGCAAAVFGQTAPSPTPAMEKPPLPPGPLLAKMPDFSKWTITVIDKNAAVAAPTPTQASSGGKSDQATAPKAVVTITKTIPIILVSTVGKSDNSTVWCVGTFQIHQDAEYQKPALFSAASRVAVYVDYSKTDFPELQWIAEKNYVGVQKTGDQQYLVFRDNVPNAIPEVVNRARANAVATKTPFNESLYIDARETFVNADTKLPVFWRKGSEYHVYKFVDPPTAMLTLPPNLRSMIEFEQSRLRDLARRPPSG